MDIEQKLLHLFDQIISDTSGIKSNSLVTIKCECGKETTTSARNLYRRWPIGPYLCKSCSVKIYANNPDRIEKFKKSFAKTASTEEHKAKASAAAKSFWHDPKFEEKREKVKKSISENNKTNPLKIAAREKASKIFMENNGKEHLDRIRKIAGESMKRRCKEDPEYVEILRERFRHALDKPESKEKHRIKTIKNSKKMWEDPKHRKKMAKIHSNPEYLARASEIGKELWEDPEYRAKMTEIYSDPEYIKKLSEISSKRQNDPEYRKKMAKITRELWQNPEHRKMMLVIFNSEEYKKLISGISKKQWENPEYRNKIIDATCFAMQNTEVRKKIAEASKKLWQDPKYCEKMLEASKKLWQDPKHRAKMLEVSKKLWQDPEHREKMAAVRANQPKVSSLQNILYSILDDLNIKYYREHNDKADDLQCTVGPYNFDCVIPRDGKPDLLLECQGEYWHGLDKVIRNDKSKATYIENNFSEQYEMKYLWEHEFKCKDKIQELLKYWMGVTELELIDFSFKDLEIKPCPAKDYRLLLSKYHYLPNAGRGGIAYGAYLGEDLVAVCIFSPPIRQNVASSLGYKNSEVRELSRLCIHPRYQKKNLATWFISRCIKQLDSKFKCVVSYCDTTFNHDGAVYKAANFILDGEIKPDYWYVDGGGWVMHKKTLYGHAVNMKMKERKYAEANGYKRVYGDKKLRFIYKR